MTVDEKLILKDPERVSRMFTEISPRYDLLNRVLSFGLEVERGNTEAVLAAKMMALAQEESH